MNKIIDCNTTLLHQNDSSDHVICILSQNKIAHDYCDYLQDESRMTEGYADQLIFPFNEYQIIDILATNFKSKQLITISGARTGLVGGAVPMGGILMSTDRMRSVLNVQSNEAEASVTVQPGITLTELSEYLKNYLPQWFYPPDPTEKSASIGGTVAANASGSRSYKYGQTRRYVKRLRVVLCDGTLLEIKRGDFYLTPNQIYIIQGEQRQFKFSIPDIDTTWIKNTAGYFICPEMDLIDLFIGSEGTLGVITEIELNLTARPNHIFAAIAFFHSEKDAVQFVFDIKRSVKKQSAIDPSAIEFFDRQSIRLLRNEQENGRFQSEIPRLPDSAEAAVFFEQEYPDERSLENMYSAYDAILQNQHISMDQTWGGMTNEEIEKLDRFRHMLPETVNMIIGQRQNKIPGLHKISTDFVVPEEQLNCMIRVYKNLLNKSGLDYVIFGHIGENHLHVNIIPKDSSELKNAKLVYLQLAREAVRLGGTISGEHGIGRLKKNLLNVMYDQKLLTQFHQIKLAFDPYSCLENGVIF